MLSDVALEMFPPIDIQSSKHDAHPDHDLPVDRSPGLLFLTIRPSEIGVESSQVLPFRVNMELLELFDVRSIPNAWLGSNLLSSVSV